MLVWLLEHRPYSLEVIEEATAYGHVAVMQFCHEIFPHARAGGCTKEAMREAAATGHKDVVAGLHDRRRRVHDDEYGRSRCERPFGQFLHARRCEGCTVLAMDSASRACHLEVPRFLHEDRSKDWTAIAISLLPLGLLQRAAYSGNAAVVKFVFETSSDGCLFEARALADHRCLPDQCH